MKLITFALGNLPIFSFSRNILQKIHIVDLCILFFGFTPFRSNFLYVNPSYLPVLFSQFIQLNQIYIWFFKISESFQSFCCCKRDAIRRLSFFYVCLKSLKIKSIDLLFEQLFTTNHKITLSV